MKQVTTKIAVFMMVLALMLPMCVMPAYALDVQSNASAQTQTKAHETGFVYTVLNDGTAEIAGYTGYDTDIVIPSTIDGYKVTSIGNSAFLKDTTLTNVEIPSGVTKIGEYAFAYCDSLGNTIIPSSVTNIAENAFINHSDELTIYCFKNTTASNFAKNNNICRAEFLYKVLEDGTAEIRAYYDGATDVLIPSTVDGYVVTSIGDQAFIFSDVESVVIPDTVTKIDDYAFCQCTSLKSVKMPNKLTYLGEYAFAYTAISHITIPEGIKYIYECAFAHCEELESVTIPDSVEKILGYAFRSCDSLNCVVLPENLESIGVLAFADCTSLESIIIPFSVKYIRNDAFDGCTDTFSVFGYVDTEAQYFAQRNGITFVPFNVSI